EIPALVDVATIAGPVPTVVQLRGVRGVVVVVALEGGRTSGVDDLPDGFVGVAHPAVLVELRGRAHGQGVRIHNAHAVPRRHTQTSLGSVFDPPQHTGTLTGTVTLVQPTVEATQELTLILRCGFGAESVSQRIDGIIVRLGLGKDVT